MTWQTLVRLQAYQFTSEPLQSMLRMAHLHMSRLCFESRSTELGKGFQALPDMHPLPRSDSALHGLSPKASSENVPNHGDFEASAPDARHCQVRAGSTMFGLARAHRSGAVVAGSGCAFECGCASSEPLPGRTDFVDQAEGLQLAAKVLLERCRASWSRILTS